MFCTLLARGRFHTNAVARKRADPRSDGNIRYFEYEHDKFEFLSEYKSTDPQRGVAFMPKRGVSVSIDVHSYWHNADYYKLHENEVARAFKTVNDNYIEPISFIVPRRAEVFQDDIYPPCTGLKPAVSADEFFAGKDGLPPKFSLESVYVGETPQEVPAESRPAPTPAPAPKAEPKPEPKEEPKPEPTPAPAARSPPASLHENKVSMASMADKFADKEPEESVDEASSFEEIPKPVERPSATTARVEEKTRGPEISKAPEPAAAPAKAAEPEPVKEAPRSASTSSNAASHAAAGIKDYLAEIKTMLETQSSQMTNQMEQITHLTAEVNVLKTKVADISSGGEKDERIRQLELELEEARS